MQTRLILKVLGFLLIIFSVSLMPPLLIGWFDADGTHLVFLQSWIAVLVLGALMWLPNRKKSDDLRIRDGFLIVVLFWLVLALSGALPFMLAEDPYMSVIDAVFESMSGLTTTGATVLTGLDALPRSILYYRQQLQWLGGMGIIVLAVAIAPVLGVGGMQLFRAETPGPMKNNKLTPRITETAKALWYIYFGLTVLCAMLYFAAGMNLFDAIGHSFSTLAIGGFSTHDKSIGFFNNPLIDIIAMLFMVIAGINFSLHYLAIRRRSLRQYVSDSEVKAFLLILATLSVITVTLLILEGTFEDTGVAIRLGLFQVISVATTTGFTTNNFSYWPGLLPVLLIISSFVGGCAGSTAGGMKVIRVELLLRQGRREIDRLLHPNAVLPIKLNKRPVPDSVINAVWGFFALYVISFVSLGLLMMMSGSDIVTAFSATAACLNNLGPGLGDVANNYQSISDAGKWILSFTMLLGRLELFSLLVVLTPAFWKR
ncbi:MAG: TrkH family potassium uptake protein [Gammaproteobacteria bacterium]|nr:TrkH family potassium uptake protein [Gammaproteobacteria bacterium]MDX2487842.1 TrkH family potassium uptake protein [Gammaproteobacteria bacterium]